MKIRNSFVANSSSSSFVVIKELNKKKDLSKYIFGHQKIFQLLTKNDYNITVPFKMCDLESDFIGETTFDRSKVLYHSDFYSKLNFVVLFLREYYDSKGKNVFKSKEIKYITKLLRKLFKAKKIDYIGLFYDEPCFYIDHGNIQDSVYEKIFKDKKTLYNFLLNEESFVVVGDDNEIFEIERDFNNVGNKET